MITAQHLFYAVSLTRTKESGADQYCSFAEFATESVCEAWGEQSGSYCGSASDDNFRSSTDGADFSETIGSGLSEEDW